MDKKYLPINNWLLFIKDTSCRNFQYTDDSLYIYILQLINNIYQYIYNILSYKTMNNNI